jgi:hypothetical protein
MIGMGTPTSHRITPRIVSSNIDAMPAKPSDAGEVPHDAVEFLEPSSIAHVF